MVRQSSMTLARLLRQLVLREKVRTNITLLIFSDDSRQTVRSGCVHLSDVVEEQHRNRLRVYAAPSGSRGRKKAAGAWPNSGRGSPTIVIEADELPAVLTRSGLGDLEDFAGSYFAFIKLPRRNAAGHEFILATETSTSSRSDRSMRAQR